MVQGYNFTLQQRSYCLNFIFGLIGRFCPTGCCLGTTDLPPSSSGVRKTPALQVRDRCSQVSAWTMGSPTSPERLEEEDLPAVQMEDGEGRTGAGGWCSPDEGVGVATASLLTRCFQTEGLNHHCLRWLLCRKPFPWSLDFWVLLPRTKSLPTALNGLECQQKQHSLHALCQIPWRMADQPHPGPIERIFLLLDTTFSQFISSGSTGP